MPSCETHISLAYFFHYEPGSTRIISIIILNNNVGRYKIHVKVDLTNYYYCFPIFGLIHITYLHCNIISFSLLINIWFLKRRWHILNCGSCSGSRRLTALTVYDLYNSNCTCKCRNIVDLTIFKFEAPNSNL